MLFIYDVYACLRVCMRAACVLRVCVGLGRRNGNPHPKNLPLRSGCASGAEPMVGIGRLGRVLGPAKWESASEELAAPLRIRIRSGADGGHR